ANTLRVNVTSVNDAPSGTDNTVTTDEDTAYTFASGDFGFSDVSDTPADSLAAVKITALPTAGSLSNDGVDVAAGDEVSVADIAAGKLVFTPAANANGAGYASFDFKVRDDGGTGNGGVDLAVSANTITVNVTSVNDAPSGADKTVTILEDGSETFTAADFGFSDLNDSPADHFAGIVVASAPAAGSLTDDGVVLTGDEVVSAADIAAGKLVFTPAANANGARYACL